MITGIGNVNSTNKVLGAYQNHIDTRQPHKLPNQGTDKAQISTQGQEFKAVFDAIANTPEVREDRVAELTNRINSGEYNISSRDIAVKMLNEGWL